MTVNISVIIIAMAIYTIYDHQRFLLINNNTANLEHKCHVQLCPR